jgi:two-component system, NtrC family, nitrogen regulation response regulator NtrX
VHDLPTRVQLRLARVLRDGEVLVDDGSPDGTLLSLRVRIVASIDPSPSETEDDRLSSELARRLPSRIMVPALRDRREDIPGLVRNLLGEECGSLRLPAKTASQQAVALLSALPWRGNLDEMRGVLGTLALKVPGRRVRLNDVLANVRLDNTPTPFRVGGTLKEARERFEREYVAAVLAQHNGRMSEAARSLGIQRTNLYRKIRQLSVERRNGRS